MAFGVNGQIGQNAMFDKATALLFVNVFADTSTKV